jgi:hypothetical protein
MQECQKKRLTKWALRKCVILKDMFLVVWEEQEPKKLASEGRKAGASSRTPNAVFYTVNYSTGQGEVGKLWSWVSSR